MTIDDVLAARRSRLRRRTPAEAAAQDITWIVFRNEGNEGNEGYASPLAAASPQAIGLRNATDLVGGFQAWKEAGLPVTDPGRGDQGEPGST